MLSSAKDEDESLVQESPARLFLGVWFAVESHRCWHIEKSLRWKLPRCNEPFRVSLLLSLRGQQEQHKEQQLIQPSRLQLNFHFFVNKTDGRAEVSKTEDAYSTFVDWVNQNPNYNNNTELSFFYEILCHKFNCLLMEGLDPESLTEMDMQDILNQINEKTLSKYKSNRSTK